MITKDIIKQVLVSNQKDVERYKVVSRALLSDDFPCRVFKGETTDGKGMMEWCHGFKRHLMCNDSGKS